MLFLLQMEPTLLHHTLQLAEAHLYDSKLS